MALATMAVAAMVAVDVMAGTSSAAVSGAETRTISLYHTRTGESLTVTYMVNGRYVPSAMKQINYLLRDWRKNQVITIDPKTIDLVWELHADLGSRAPVNIVSGYRSAATNNFLKSIGRNVARQSQHILGKAIDIYFTDVPTVKLRNSALVRGLGGVGYYPSSGGPSGFLHVDSGRVRQWGPFISQREMAQIFRDYRTTVGARLNRRDLVMVASSASKLPSQQAGKIIPDDRAPDLADDELASLSEKASAVPNTAPPKIVAQVSAEPDRTEAAAAPIPRPRPKPIEVLMMAAVNMKIEPASAPPPTAVEHNSPVADSIGVVPAAETMTETSDPVSNVAAKQSLAAAILDGTASDVPLIRTITASAGSQDLFWWPQRIILNSDQAMRRDGAPQPFLDANGGILQSSAEAAEVPALPRLAVASMPEVASGKGDLLVVNREGKGSLPAGLQLPEQRHQKVGLLETQ
ncbi:MAG: DUF882 domain-containing protein [Rhizobiales bacterium]|nr:DUF882 domain-containing protein [Hyphomicrobiales bacterium]MBI3674815.1 DUF882 domain-containing protein [Hyphomicrobiales bacterium]